MVTVCQEGTKFEPSYNIGLPLYMAHDQQILKLNSLCGSYKDRQIKFISQWLSGLYLEIQPSYNMRIDFHVSKVLSILRFNHLYSCSRLALPWAYYLLHALCILILKKNGNSLSSNHSNRDNFRNSRCKKINEEVTLYFQFSNRGLNIMKHYLPTCI